MTNEEDIQQTASISEVSNSSDKTSGIVEEDSSDAVDQKEEPSIKKEALKVKTSLLDTPLSLLRECNINSETAQDQNQDQDVNHPKSSSIPNIPIPIQNQSQATICPTNNYNFKGPHNPRFPETTGHKLHSGWTLYVDKTPNAGSSLQDYTQNLKKIYKVSTIEGFWQVFNNIPSPSDLQPRYSFHLMRGDRRPIWEDPLNENGGYWKLKCHKNNTEIVWKELVLAAIGEQFRDSVKMFDNIVGVSVSIRDKDDHFQVWNENWEGAVKSGVVEKITKQLLPKIKFHSTFYKEHKNHHKFEKNPREGFFKKNNGNSNNNNKKNGNNKTKNKNKIAK